MTMNIQQDEYVTEAGDTAGVVVLIQPQNQMPFPEDDGTLVSPGFATSIAVVQVTCDAVLRLHYLHCQSVSYRLSAGLLDPVCTIQPKSDLCSDDVYSVVHFHFYHRVYVYCMVAVCQSFIKFMID